MSLASGLNRHYAKRQLTWFHRDERIQWFNLTTTPIAAVKKVIISTIKST
jgi:tRNA A37 N6-isopentenylltransferase MiaA